MGLFTVIHIHLLQKMHLLNYKLGILDGLVRVKTAMVSLYWFDARWAGTSKDWIGLLVLVRR